MDDDVVVIDFEVPAVPVTGNCTRTDRIVPHVIHDADMVGDYPSLGRVCRTGVWVDVPGISTVSTLNVRLVQKQTIVITSRRSVRTNGVLVICLDD